MNGRILILAALCCVVSCGRPLSEEMVISQMKRCPTAADLDSKNGELRWNYTTGLELKSFLDVYQSCKSNSRLDRDSLLRYIDAWYDAVIAEDGSIGGRYSRSSYNLDHICPARTLFDLYDITGKEKYRAAMDTIYIQVNCQPKNEAGAFWHKTRYPHQQWLDGLYMAQPFYAQYCVRFLRSCMEKGVNFDEICDQFRIAYDKCYDPATRLLRHAWDGSRESRWCNPENGQSAHAWGRALGWYMMALVDVLDFVPEDHPGREPLMDILKTLLETLPEYADPATGMWYQVLDCPGREGNYIESTCSAMFCYSYLKAVQKGYTPQYAKYSRKLYRSLVKNFIRRDPDGTISLTRCCAVAGLGQNGDVFRDGSFDYYVNEKIIDNDPKGIGPFIWASLLYENK